MVKFFNDYLYQKYIKFHTRSYQHVPANHYMPSHPVAFHPIPVHTATFRTIAHLPTQLATYRRKRERTYMYCMHERLATHHTRTHTHTHNTHVDMHTQMLQAFAMAFIPTMRPAMVVPQRLIMHMSFQFQFTIFACFFIAGHSRGPIFFSRLDRSCKS